MFLFKPHLDGDMSDFLNAHVLKIDYFKVKSLHLPPAAYRLSASHVTVRQPLATAIDAGGLPALCYLGSNHANIVWQRLYVHTGIHYQCL